MSLHAPHVVFILIDSFRPSYLESFGGNPSTLPNLNKFASSGLNFKCSFAASSHSDYEDVVISSGRHQIRDVGHFSYSKLAASSLSNFDLLHHIYGREGYKTAFISSQNEFWCNIHYRTGLNDWDFLQHAGQFGLHERENCGKLPDQKTIDASIEWVEQNCNVPFYLAINLQDAHIPYSVIRPDDSNFEPGRLMSVCDNVGKKIRTRYARSLSELDQRIGKLLTQLDSLLGSENFVLAITSDTGQSFGEHGYYGHGRDTFVESLHVPMLIRSPSIQPSEINALVSHVDFLPILLEVSKLERATSHQGFGLHEILNFERIASFSVCLTPIGKQFCVRTMEYTLIYDAQKNECYFFDRIRDPRELHPLRNRMGHKFDSLLAQLQKWVGAQINFHRQIHVASAIPPNDRNFQ